MLLFAKVFNLWSSGLNFFWWISRSFKDGLDWVSQTFVFLICTSFPRFHRWVFVSWTVEFHPMFEIRIPEHLLLENQIWRGLHNSRLIRGLQGGPLGFHQVPLPPLPLILIPTPPGSGRLWPANFGQSIFFCCCGWFLVWVDVLCCCCVFLCCCVLCFCVVLLCVWWGCVHGFSARPSPPPPDRSWPTLAKPTSTWVCVCFCVCLWVLVCVLVSRFPCGGFKVFVQSCLVPRDRPSRDRPKFHSFF